MGRESGNKNYPCAAINGGISCNDHTQCEHCGFNPAENLFRKRYLRKFGLTERSDGKKQLVVTSDKRKKLQKTV